MTAWLKGNVISSEVLPESFLGADSLIVIMLV